MSSPWLPLDSFDADQDAIARAIERRGMFNLIHISAVVKVDFIVRKDDPFRREEFRRRRAVAHLDRGYLKRWAAHLEVDGLLAEIETS